MKSALFNALCNFDCNNSNYAINDNRNDITQKIMNEKKARKFKLKDILSGPASWNTDQNLYIFE